MKRYLRLLQLFARVSIQDNAAYRVDFVLHAVLAFVQFGAELVVLWTIFSNTQSLAGWNAMELMALVGVFRIMIGTIAMIIAPNMRAIMEEIRDGKLDFAILKPLNTQFFASTRRFVPWHVSDILAGLGLIAFAMTRLSATLSPGRLAIFVVMLAAGITIIYSFWLALATMAFWFTRINNIEMVFWNVFEAGRYPVHIYRPWLRWGLTYIVPLAFLTTFPASSLLVGKMEPGNAIAALLLAGISFVFSSWFWRYGLKHYSGASS